MNVLFDTNFLIECAKKKIDFFLECERILDRPRIVILKQVTKELELILPMPSVLSPLCPKISKQEILLKSKLKD